MLSSEKNQKRSPRPWLRKIEYLSALYRDGNLIYGHTEENGEFVEHEDGIENKVEVRKGYFEHWGIDFIRPDITSPQLVQVTVAYIIDAETGMIIKVNNTSNIKFI